MSVEVYVDESERIRKMKFIDDGVNAIVIISRQGSIYMTRYRRPDIVKILGLR